MIRAIDLLDTAAKLLQGQPSQTDLRRGMSTVYYALFHHVCDQFSAIVLDPTPAGQKRAWLQAYRYPDHGAAKQRCLEVARGRVGFPVSLERFAQVFAKLQQDRTDADYNPSLSLSVTDVTRAIFDVQLALSDFAATPPEHKRAFVLFICLRPKSR